MKPVRAARWRGFAGGVLDLLFPPVCVHCGGLVDDLAEEDPGAVRFRHLCRGCQRRIPRVGPPHCTTCGYPFFGVRDENIGCAHCALLRPGFREGRTATLLQGPVRPLVHGLKYDRALHLLRDMEAVIAGNAYFCGFCAGCRLVPVPLHPRKLRERGYNQAQLIAEVIARHAPEVVIAPVLQRVIFTQTQTRLDRAARQDNLKNAFALAPRAPLEPDCRYVLVDDVFTSGATLNGCARVLRRAGLKNIDVVTFGHG